MRGHKRGMRGYERGELGCWCRVYQRVVFKGAVV